jgi:hypothetical protein
MTTWHQERNGRALPKLSHPTNWSSYNSRGHMAVMRHESYEACKTYCDKTGEIPVAPDNLKGAPNADR